MRTQQILFLAIAALAAAACSTPHIAIDRQLQTHTQELPVKGRQGWQINQVLTLGDYRTGKVERGWTKSYDIPFVVRFSGASERLGFDLFDPAGGRTHVLVVGKLREQDMPLFRDLFRVNLNSRDLFTGTVVVQEQDGFDFYIANLNQNNWFREASGVIRGRDVAVDIRPVQRLDSGKKMLSQQAPGFEFVMDGKVVGAVETLNEGRVWLRNDLSADVKTIITGVSAALLLRTDLDEALSAL